jgi:DNA-binding ferritin-like protein (Dps family)
MSFDKDLDRAIRTVEEELEKAEAYGNDRVLDTLGTVLDDLEDAKVSDEPMTKIREDIAELCDMKVDLKKNGGDIDPWMSRFYKSALVKIRDALRGDLDE